MAGFRATRFRGPHRALAQAAQAARRAHRRLSPCGPCRTATGGGAACTGRPGALPGRGGEACVLSFTSGGAISGVCHLWRVRLRVRRSSQVSLKAIRSAVGGLEEVHFVLFGTPTFNAYVDAAVKLFGPPLEDDEEEDEEETEREGEDEEEDEEQEAGGSGDRRGGESEPRHRSPP